MNPPEGDAEERARAERENKALKLAVEQARSDERLKARLDGHEKEIAITREGLAKQSHKLDGVVEQLKRVEQTLAAQAAVSAAGLSNRTFLIGVIAVVVSIVAVFFGAGVH